ncbi:MAG: hypothetical protein VB078_04180 [Clostridiaceae bacterium]|nr:hypothetical protein [Clostridiaceae bacterium]
MQLSPSEITYLASCFEKTNPLSPFVNNKKDLLGSEADTLTEKGILNGGVLTQEAAELLFPLSRPERCSRMILQKPFCLLEKYTYLNSGRLTLAESDGQGLVITALEGDSSAVIDVLDDFCPGSSIKNSGIHITLPPTQAIVLLACIDFCRVKALGAYLSGQGADMTFTSSDIASQLESGFINGLVYGLSGNCGVKLPENATVPSLMVILEQQGVIAPSGEKGIYALTPDYRLFASNFLIYDSLMLLEAFELTGENKMAASMDLCFCCGMHDIIAFSATPEGFEITSLSGAELRSRMKDTLDCPSFSSDGK